MKHTAAKLAAFQCAALLAFSTTTIWSVPAYAVESLGNDNHLYDTEDYCLRASDVRVGLSERALYPSLSDIQIAVMDASKPEVLVRSSWESVDTWKVDFSSFSWTPSAEGYPVVLTMPSLTPGLLSQITFRVYVVDDLPVVSTAMVSFANCDLSPITLEFEKGEGALLRFEDISVPVKDGYAFEGWYFDEELREACLLPNDLDFAHYLVMGDVILYPKWTKIPDPVEPPVDPVEPPVTPADPPVMPTDPVVPPTVDPDPQPQIPQQPTDSAVPLPLPVVVQPYAIGSSDEEVVASPQAEESTSNNKVEPQALSAQRSAVQQQNESVSNADEPSGAEADSQGGFPMGEAIVLVTMYLAVTILGASIVSDMRVLQWYASKKKAAGA